MRLAFFMVWVYGFLVYDIGMCTGEPISLVANAPLAALYAFKIFLLDSDISEIHNAFHESWFYSLNFALAHFFAAIISTLFVLKYFGFNIHAKWRMWLESHLRTVDQTYVFWGFNDASEKLIENIQQHYSKDEKSKKLYRIVLIRLSNGDDDNPETRTGIGRIFDFLSIPTSELEKLQRLKCLTVGTYSNVANINVANEETDVLRDKFSLNSLKRILKKRTREKIHILFLGDNEKENIHAVSLLLKDKSLKDFVNKRASEDGKGSRHEVIFYCHARYNSVHRVIEDLNSTANIRVKVIDSSHINVEILKRTREILPAQFVDVQPDGRVSSTFNSLVVGFSEVGQDSVRFLYEYGAFVDNHCSREIVRRSQFHMDVVDNHMNDLAGAFMANAPSIDPYLAKGEWDIDNSALITLHNLNCNSASFYNLVTKKIKDLNYIVIATEDDELNISLGIRIFKLALRYRDDLNNFCILVRAHNDDDGHLLKITHYYNRLYAALGKDFDTSCKVQTEIKRDKICKLPLYIFGLDKDVYTYDNIIDDVIETEAAKYKEAYGVASGDKETTEVDPKKMAWYTEYIELMQLDREHEDYSPTYCGIMRLRRTREQDIANYLHKTTKEIIVEKALQAAKKAGKNYEINWQQYSRAPKQIKYLKNGVLVEDYATELLDVLAQMEHLRWNAAHEILGYIRAGEVSEKDEVRLTHSCLRNYNDFDKNDAEHVKALSYDNSVVDLTFGIPKSQPND